MSSYTKFLAAKLHEGSESGFEPIWMPDSLFPFQCALTEWAIRKGRAAMFADCGLGKSAMQLVWAQNVVQKTNGRVLILTPLAVGAQTVREGIKFGVPCKLSRDGSLPDKIVVTNYQQLHKFNSSDFAGVVCDESSILKSFDGQIRSAVTEFMRRIPYRLLCTATAAPNDYIELGTSSEALGEMRRVEMMAHFFNHDGGDTSKWRLKKHAAKGPFWQWINSWARAVQSPADLGFHQPGYDLPPLVTREHVVSAATPRDGMLFTMPAVTLDEQRDERRRTLTERCELAAALASHSKPVVAWCHLNAEGDLLTKLIPGAAQVDGSTPDEAKEEAFEAFACGQIRALVSKPQVSGWGLNWQHCAHQTFFPSHSFEQWYQSIRRCWRFGQTSSVTVDVIASEGEAGVLANMQRKAGQARMMFAKMISLLHQETVIAKPAPRQSNPIALPSWIHS